MFFASLPLALLCFVVLILYSSACTLTHTQSKEMQKVWENKRWTKRTKLLHIFVHIIFVRAYFSYMCMCTKWPAFSNYKKSDIRITRTGQRIKRILCMCSTCLFLPIYCWEISGFLSNVYPIRRFSSFPLPTSQQSHTSKIISVFSFPFFSLTCICICNEFVQVNSQTMWIWLPLQFLLHRGFAFLSIVVVVWWHIYARKCNSSV